MKEKQTLEKMQGFFIEPFLDHSRNDMEFMENMRRFSNGWKNKAFI